MLPEQKFKKNDQPYGAVCRDVTEDNDRSTEPLGHISEYITEKDNETILATLLSRNHFARTNGPIGHLLY